MFDSVTSVALQSALDGLSMRQKVIANNIANINTPNYHAEKVQFEDALAKSIVDGDGGTQERPSGTPGDRAPRRPRQRTPAAHPPPVRGDA